MSCTLTSGPAGDLSGAGAGERSVPSTESPLTYEETLAGEEEVGEMVQVGLGLTTAGACDC